jgi:predicted transcriptional regulator
VIFTNRYEVKKFLESYKLIKKEVERLNALRRELELDMTSLKAVDYSKIRVEGSAGTSCVLEVVMDRLEELKNQIAEVTAKKYDIEKEVIALINKLDNKNNDVDILMDRYIHLLKYHEIERKYSYTYESLKNKISKAYMKLALLSKF